MILRRLEVVFGCLEWECWSFWRIDGNSFKSTNTIVYTMALKKKHWLTLWRLDYEVFKLWCLCCIMMFRWTTKHKFHKKFVKFKYLHFYITEYHHLILNWVLFFFGGGGGYSNATVENEHGKSVYLYIIFSLLWSIEWYSWSVIFSELHFYTISQTLIALHVGHYSVHVKGGGQGEKTVPPPPPLTASLKKGHHTMSYILSMPVMGPPPPPPRLKPWFATDVWSYSSEFFQVETLFNNAFKTKLSLVKRP